MLLLNHILYNFRFFYHHNVLFLRDFLYHCGLVLNLYGRILLILLLSRWFTLDLREIIKNRLRELWSHSSLDSESIVDLLGFLALCLILNSFVLGNRLISFGCSRHLGGGLTLWNHGISLFNTLKLIKVLVEVKESPLVLQCLLLMLF